MYKVLVELFRIQAFVITYQAACITQLAFSNSHVTFVSDKHFKCVGSLLAEAETGCIGYGYGYGGGGGAGSGYGDGRI